MPRGPPQDPRRRGSAVTRIDAPSDDENAETGQWALTRRSAEMGWRARQVCLMAGFGSRSCNVVTGPLARTCGGIPMPYAVDFETVSTVGLESSPVAEALAGLRANEARYFRNK